MRIRPCIDLHGGKVKQIIGGTLTDDDSRTQINFESRRPPAYYADLFWRDGLTGGHVIKLGPGNDAAAREAVSAHPGSLQLGGGVTPANAHEWLDAGASKVIVTSYLFEDNRFSLQRLREMVKAVGRERLVVDVSCRRVGDQYTVACNRWQTLTQLTLDREVLEQLSEYCSEFLVHAVDVEGRQHGIEEVLVEQLGQWAPISTTYAGGVRSLADIESVRVLGRGRLDVTVGSALDIFGGSGVLYRDLVELDKGLR